jgi:putative flippase GtrA
MTVVLGQLGRFIVVGAAATATHVGVAMGLVEGDVADIGLANAVAFTIALAVSYAGNYGWTFAAGGAHARRLPRFAAVAVLGLALNQLIIFVLAGIAAWDYRIALAVVVLVVPGLSFVVNRRWVFGERSLLAAPGRSS